jgi:release factor glutamine methyltransferase|tara:strand:+ start:188 stop:868 length:681 start_codon:yes stop_codon:yes gene_type:complete
MQEKKKYLEGTAQVLRESQKEKGNYKVKIMGKEFVVHPNVFSPKYYKDTEFFAKELPVNIGDELLEIGCGTGIVSIFAIWKGASRVTAIDINPAAIKNAKENVKIHKLENRIKIIKGDVFEPLKDEQFDAIFWNTPFGYTKTQELTDLEKAVFDPEYKSTKKFIGGAKKHLRKNGRLIIGFSSTLGHFGELKKLLKAAGYKYKILKQVDSEEVHPVKFEIIEAKLG